MCQKGGNMKREERKVEDKIVGWINYRKGKKEREGKRKSEGWRTWERKKGRSAQSKMKQINVL